PALNDHITHRYAVYASRLRLGGNRRFVLSNSGHIQSMLNPPGKPKANYHENAKLTSDPRAWYHDAQHQPGSWWPQWLEWIQARSGEQRETLMALGNQHHPAMEAAPGTYVHIR
ncbi:MAG TPA: class II poly(R)-hydroxyalkanoic acid synthase, partial [Pseudomonas sp.]|nr:class II poly(R)-hydroxyalkanoic acid synthase [Pseudomonas sp.]